MSDQMEGQDRPEMPPSAEGEGALPEEEEEEVRVTRMPEPGAGGEGMGPSEPEVEPTSAAVPTEAADLRTRFESEMRRVSEAVSAAEGAAAAVGLRTTISGGRVECDYDMEADSIMVRSVSFELEF